MLASKVKPRTHVRGDPRAGCRQRDWLAAVEAGRVTAATPPGYLNRRARHGKPLPKPKRKPDLAANIRSFGLTEFRLAANVAGALESVGVTVADGESVAGDITP